MIYKNIRPFPIEVVNPRTGEHRAIQPNGITPELPEGLERTYNGYLVPLFSSPVPQNFSKLLKTNELFEKEDISDGLFDVGNTLLENDEEKVSEPILLNEVKRGRGRPKKA